MIRAFLIDDNIKLYIFVFILDYCNNINHTYKYFLITLPPPYIPMSKSTRP